MQEFKTSVFDINTKSANLNSKKTEAELCNLTYLDN